MGRDLPVLEPPIACSLGAAERVARGDEFRKLFEAGLTSCERIPGGIRLRFRSSLVVGEHIREMIRKEERCCPFFDYRLEHGARGSLILEIHGPGDAAPLLDALIGLARSVGRARLAR